jgi:hypothetical protein
MDYEPNEVFLRAYERAYAAHVARGDKRAAAWAAAMLANEYFPRGSSRWAQVGIRRRPPCSRNRLKGVRTVSTPGRMHSLR